ncbi:MAG: type II toxin-antitoxin system RelE/ParE family toxin [Alphaproteobacteria bacterium]
MIRSFADKRTAALFAGFVVRDLPNQLQRRAKAKLQTLDAARRLNDLRVPPGNRLEALKGDRAGQHSIRINEQRRVCLVWRACEAWNVGIVDCHNG